MSVRRAAAIELKIFFAVLSIAVLNLFVLTALTSRNSGVIDIIGGGIATTFVVYASYIFSSIFLIIIHKGEWLRIVFYLLLSYMTLHVLGNLIILITNKTVNDNGQAILTDAMLIWLSSLLVFSLWYWVIDRNGLVARELEFDETRYDLLFPQYQTKIPGWEKWKPQFLDYVFFSFFTSTGFSPADTLPLTKRVKTLMMVEATISLVIIGMVAARAISLIQ